MPLAYLITSYFGTLSGAFQFVLLSNFLFVIKKGFTQLEKTLLVEIKQELTK